MQPDDKACLLVVEDDPHIQLLLRHFLKSAFDLEIVPGVEEALQRAARRHFDLFVLDINLGVQHTGVDVLNALRRMPGYRATPMVACTAYAQRGDRENFFALGFDAYVAKPFKREVLLATIQAALSPVVTPGVATAHG